MGSNDRISRHKELTRHNILEAALHLGKSYGWQNLSMRKVAEAIEYTAPIIYEYFASKEDLLRELARQGFILLIGKLTEAKSNTANPKAQLESMMIAYWNFAFAERTYYQIMFGIDFTCSDLKNSLPEADSTALLFLDIISDILNLAESSSELVLKHYYSFWSILHGLIAINLIQKDMPNKFSGLMLKEAVTVMMEMLNSPELLFNKSETKLARTTITKTLD